MSEIRVIHGDALAVLKGFEAEIFDALVTDPPAGVSFMNARWDSDKGGRREWIDWLAGIMREALRVLKPGAHGLVWALPRTSHWTGMALEDAGFEVRDIVSHVFGTGFCKNHNISKAIDREAGAENVIGTKPDRWTGKGGTLNFSTDRPQSACKVTAPATPEAAQWEGFGTALKPATEFWYLVRKPLRGTVAANVLAFGTGGLNIDGCRVAADARPLRIRAEKPRELGDFQQGAVAAGETSLGRWPSHLVMSHSVLCGPSCHESCPVRLMDEQSGESSEKSRTLRRNGQRQMEGWGLASESIGVVHGDSGTASRFFLCLPADPFIYCPKPSTAERERGLEHRARRRVTDGRAASADNPRLRGETERGNTHPTVKSIFLMQYLCKLICPPGGAVLDCFMGSGSTGVACLREGFGFTGIDADVDFAEIARSRIEEEAPLFVRGAI